MLKWSEYSFWDPKLVQGFQWQAEICSQIMTLKTLNSGIVAMSQEMEGTLKSHYKASLEFIAGIHTIHGAVQFPCCHHPSLRCAASLPVHTHCAICFCHRLLCNYPNNMFYCKDWSNSSKAHFNYYQGDTQPHLPQKKNPSIHQYITRCLPGEHAKL